LLQRNPFAYWASGCLGRLLGDTGYSPMAESILNGYFAHHNLMVCAFTAQLQRRPLLPDIPLTKITECIFSRAFGGLREKAAASPYGLYNAHDMCLVSNRTDSSPNPIHMIHSQLMEMKLTHGFTPQRHQVRFDCPIFKKPGNFKSENLRFVHGIEATDNQTIKIGVTWQIKCMVREYDNIF
jgi:hypothetical protein